MGTNRSRGEKADEYSSHNIIGAYYAEPTLWLEPTLTNRHVPLPLVGWCCLLNAYPPLCSPTRSASGTIVVWRGCQVGTSCQTYPGGSTVLQSCHLQYDRYLCWQRLLPSPSG